jgi:hypothetical protein
MPHERLGGIASTVRKGIFDINASAYTETGVPFVRITNLRGGLIAADDIVFIPRTIHAAESKTALQRGDVVLSKTAYPAASWVNLDECNVSQDTIAVKLTAAATKKLRSAAVVVFLNTRHGLALMQRQFQGNVQAHLSLPDAKKLPIPILDDVLQGKLESCVLGADALIRIAHREITTAEHALLRALGLENWQPSEPLTYTRSASDVFGAGRIDSEFFAPRVDDLLSHLRPGAQTVGSVAPARCESFIPGGPGDFDYLEIGSVRADGTITSERMHKAEAPSRASWIVKSGDVVTSTVRPLRRLSALITPEQDGFVASSGFLVLQPQFIPAEVLLTFLRLQPVCELMNLHTSASLYPAISERDLLKLPFPKVSGKTCDVVVQAVRSAHTARRESQVLLAKAQRAVEIAIEESEHAALKFIREATHD